MWDVPSKPSRVRLTLEEKVNIINECERDKLSVRNLAAKFNIGKTQASEILKNKKKILEKFIKKENGDCDESTPFPNTVSAIDQQVLEWFSRTRAANIPITGPHLREKALQIAETLGQTDFIASVEWLDQFKSRHKISYEEDASVDAESGDELETSVEPRVRNPSDDDEHQIEPSAICAPTVGEICNYDSQILKRPSFLEKLQNQPSTSKEPSYFTNIANVWAKKLQTLDRTQRLMVEKAVNDVFFEAELGNLHKNSVVINKPVIFCPYCSYSPYNSAGKN